MKINFIDLQRQYQAYRDEIDAQIREVVTRANFIMGDKVRELEQALAAFVGTKHAVGCASGTDALLLPLMAYDIRPGDEIVTTPFTFIATAEVIAFLKAQPVFVDIEPDTYNMDPAGIEAAVSPKTKGILAVDIFGQCADYDKIRAVARKHGLFVIEDAAQSFGAQYKGRRACSLGDTAGTSFFPAKPLGCFGDGGMVFTDDDAKAEIIRSLRVHGKGRDKYDNVRIGLNARLDTLQAGVLLAKFAHYPDEITRRQEIAARYAQGLRPPVVAPAIRPDNVSVFAQYSVLVEDRTALQGHLKNLGIPTAVHYPKPLHLQEAFGHLGYRPGQFPVTEKICDRIMSLPMHPFLKGDEQEYIITSINSFYNRQGTP